MGTPAVDHPIDHSGVDDRVTSCVVARSDDRMRTCGHRLVGVVGVLAGIGASVIAALTGLVVLCQSAGADVSISATAPPGANGLQDLLNWTAYAGAMACAGSCLYGCAKMALSHQSQSYQGANHGKAIILLSLAGALGLGLTPTIVNTLTAVH